MQPFLYQMKLINPCNKDDLSITSLGFGCARIDKKGRENFLIDECLSHKINHFDTAQQYGTENALGAALQGVINVTISTKIGLYPDDEAESYAKKIYRFYGKKILSHTPTLKRSLLKAINKYNTRKKSSYSINNDKHLKNITRDWVDSHIVDSLNNLNRDYIDFLLLHEPSQFSLNDSVNEIFSDLTSNKLIRAYGFGLTHLEQDFDFGDIILTNWKETLSQSSKIHLLHGFLRDNHVSMLEKIILKKNQGLLFSASTSRQIREVAYYYRRNIFIK